MCAAFSPTLFALLARDSLVPVKPVLYTCFAPRWAPRPISCLSPRPLGPTFVLCPASRPQVLSSSAEFGFRIEGATARGIAYPNCKELRTRTQISNALHYFLQSREGLKVACRRSHRSHRSHRSLLSCGPLPRVGGLPAAARRDAAAPRLLGVVHAARGASLVGQRAQRSQRVRECMVVGEELTSG